MRHLKRQKRHVKDQRQRPVLLRRQVRVFQQAHDGSVVEQALVEVLQAVAAEHDGDDHEVDFADELRFVDEVCFSDLGLGAEEVEGFVGIFEGWL